MWTVGDAATHAAYLDALRYSHGITVVVRTYLAGVELGTVPVESGAVRVTGRSRVRRTLDLVAPESLWPAGPGDLLSPYGTEIRVWRGITAGLRSFPLVPLFTGRVESVVRERRSGALRVSGKDRMAQLNDEGFAEVRQAPTGMSIPQAVELLIREVYPDASFVDTTASAARVPGGTQWRDGEGSRGQALDDLAVAVGAELVALPDGGFLLRPMPGLADPMAWAVSTGPGGVVVSDAQEQSRTGIPRLSRSCGDGFPGQADGVDFCWGRLFGVR